MKQSRVLREYHNAIKSPKDYLELSYHITLRHNLTDLIENIETEKLSLFEKLLFKIGDNHHPNGKTPRDLRMTFLFGKKQALKSYHKIKKWEPKNIIISHGPCMIGQAKEMLNQAFFWLEK